MNKLLIVKKIPIAMRITCLLLCLIVFQLQAEDVYSQKTKISLDMKNTTIEKVLQTIEEKSDYHFLYNNKLVNVDRKVSVRVKNAAIADVLNKLFASEDVEYQVEGNQIILLPKEKVTEIVSGVEFAQQQQKIITGKVTDTNGEPIIGATILIKGTSQGTVTDMDGNYTLQNVPEDGTLVFSYVGMQTQEIKVSNRTTIDVTMQEEAIALQEVVAIGYGTIRKSDLTGAVSSVSSEKISNRPVVNVSQALSGLAPGVEVFESSGTPTGKPRIRIRGDNSIHSSNDPLFVVDGVIGVSNIDLFNPNEIESIEVLKDASATAIYGARGANGVIIVTTKRGLKSKMPTISYDGYISSGVISKKIDLMNAEEWWKNYNITMDNAAKYDPDGYAQGKYKKADPNSMPNLFDSNGNPLYDTDWQKIAYPRAFSNNHQLSIRGGSDKTLYSAHFNYTNRDDLAMKNDYLRRYTGRINFDTELRSWLNFGANMYFSNTIGNDNSRTYGIKRLVQEALPIIPVKYPDGKWGSNRDFPGAVQDTPARYLEEIIDETSNTQTIGDLYVEFKITDDLSLKSTFAFDFNNRKRNYYSGKNLIQFSKNQGGIATIEPQKQFYWQNENYLNWNKEFNENNKLTFMGGASWQQRSAENVSATTQNFIDDFYKWHNLGAGSVIMPPSSGDWKWALNSFFGRFNYTLKNRYLFTTTGRFDGSSKFGENNRYAFFPSFAFAWRASEESFLKENKLIDNLKVRASVGETGNQEIGNYAYLQNLGTSRVIFGDNYYTALHRTTFGNPDLRWEKTFQIDAGIDVSILSQRVNFSADFYYKKTSDLLLNAPIPSSSGLNSIMRNIGEMQNKGIELSLNTYNVKSQNFNWYSTILFSANKNKIIKLGVNNEDIFPERHAQGDIMILRVGKPVGSFWGLRRLGTWGADEAEEAAKYNRLPGDLKFDDLNKDGKIDSDDRMIIGCALPDWTMTLSNSLYYQNFDFTFDIRFVIGNNVMNLATHVAEDRSGVANGWKSNLKAWTPTNQNTMIAERRPMPTYYDSYPDSHWVQDGSFIRGQNFVLGYTLKENILSKINFNKIRLYLSAQNLFCITNYNGYDPEVSTRPEATFGQGIDDLAEPKRRTFTLGINIEF
jgi:TonB-linked SusC/RagA family outer membrane protein